MCLTVVAASGPVLVEPSCVNKYVLVAKSVDGPIKKFNRVPRGPESISPLIEVPCSPDGKNDVLVVVDK